MNFSNFFYFSISVKKKMLHVYSLGLQCSIIAFVRIVVITVLILLIHEYGVSLYLLFFFSISLFRYFEFSLWETFTSMIRFIVRNVINFEATINGGCENLTLQTSFSRRG